MVFPKCGIDVGRKAAPNTPVTNSFLVGSSSNVALKATGENPQKNKPVAARNKPRQTFWYPQTSTFCPFSNLTDKIEVTKLTEFEVQWGLRRAKSSIVEKLCRKTTISLKEHSTGERFLLNDTFSKHVERDTSELQFFGAVLNEKASKLCFIT